MMAMMKAMMMQSIWAVTRTKMIMMEVHCSLVKTMTKKKMMTTIPTTMTTRIKAPTKTSYLRVDQEPVDATRQEYTGYWFND